MFTSVEERARPAGPSNHNAVALSSRTIRCWAYGGAIVADIIAIVPASSAAHRIAEVLDALKDPVHAYYDPLEP